MMGEDRRPIFAEQDGPAPGVREARVSERGMQVADAVFERGEGLLRLLGADVQGFEIARAGGGYQARAPDDRPVAGARGPTGRENRRCRTACARRGRWL